MGRLLDEKDVDSLACGCTFLGSGGGGDPAIMAIMAKQAIREMGPVRLLSPFELREEEWAVTMSLMGSQAIHYEKIMSGKELMTALGILEDEIRISAQAITPLEIGGINAITPLVAASLSGLPLVDCDAMGRAFPEFQMTTFHAFGSKASPFVMCADNGQCELLLHDSNFEIEKEARLTMTKMGGSVAAATFPMRASLLQEVAIPHTLLACKRVGEAVLAAGSDIHRVFANLSQVLHSSIYGKPHKLIEGKVVDVQRHLQEGFLQGELLVEGSGYHHSEHLVVRFLSEYLLAKQGERLLATVPDILCVLDADSGLPVMIEELEMHMKVWVIAIPSPLLLRHPKMLDVVGPWNFGVADAFVPVEQLLAEEGNGGHHVSTRN